jgi:hypothetical protein
MSDARYFMWSKQMANNKLSSAPTLKSLPPTSESFKQHFFQTHLQTMIWKSALSNSPPTEADPVKYGWKRNENGMLFPVILPENIDPAPSEVLQMIKCGCASTNPCASGRCSCVVAQMSCSIFCNCHAQLDCNNKHTRIRATEEDDDDDV